MWTAYSNVEKCAVKLPLKTWWLFLRSVWRPPHSFFRSRRVSCPSIPATWLTERLPEDDQSETNNETRQLRKEQEEVYWFHNHQCINTVLQQAQRSFSSIKTGPDATAWLESIVLDQLYWKKHIEERKCNHTINAILYIYIYSTYRSVYSRE